MSVPLPCRPRLQQPVIIVLVKTPVSLTISTKATISRHVWRTKEANQPLPTPTQPPRGVTQRLTSQLPRTRHHRTSMSDDHALSDPALRTNRSSGKGMEWMVGKQVRRGKRASFSVCGRQCVLYLFFEAAGGVTVPAHAAEAAGGDEVGAEEWGVEVRRRRRVHEGRGYLLLHGRPPGQARPLFR